MLLKKIRVCSAAFCLSAPIGLQSLFSGCQLPQCPMEQHTLRCWCRLPHCPVGNTLYFQCLLQFLPQGPSLPDRVCWAKLPHQAKFVPLPTCRLSQVGPVGCIYFYCLPAHWIKPQCAKFVVSACQPSESSWPSGPSLFQLLPPCAPCLLGQVTPLVKSPHQLRRQM